MRAHDARRLVLSLAAVSGAIVLASLGARQVRRRECRLAPRDSVRFAHEAIDTIARLRGKPQRISKLRREDGRLGFRTEEATGTAFHDGGLVVFSCGGAVRLVWLDGG